MKRLSAFFAVFACGCALAENAAHIGFIFPAGGAPGSSFEAVIGGQYLEGATNVFVTGGGVEVVIKKHTVKYDPDQYQQFYNRRRNLTGSLEDKEGEEKEKTERQIEEINRQLMLAELPDDIDPMEQRRVQRYLRENTKEQFNPQIQDRLRVKVVIDPKAEPGERELRVDTPGGLSNPIYFEVGSLDEIREEEPNDDHMAPDLQTVPVPSIINGQIMPGDIDHFKFQGVKGQQLVIDVGARRIIPYLADAVPGWFQAVAAIYDEEGKEVAYQDDYKFHPDPVLFFEVPDNGVYTLSIRDSIYRGREDFIYRIAIGELPFITSIFPLGARQGEDVDIALTGKNLPKKRLSGKLPESGDDLRHISVKKGEYRSNQMPFAIADLPEEFEKEPNNSSAEAEQIQLPVIVNGRIQQPGDRDIFSFEGSAGDNVSIEVIARRLNSPVDSVVSLSGPGLEKPARNDDYNAKTSDHLHLGAGLVTHHADSYLMQTLPSNGTYYVKIEDAQAQGGHEYGYRLRVSPAKPDFKLRMVPSGLHVAPGGTAVCTIHAVRSEGFDGPISITAANLPEDFKVSKGEIAANAEFTRITVTAPKQISDNVITPKMIGTAEIGGETVTREAVPMDDQMQAFLYRHLVPAQELVMKPVSEPPLLSFEAQLSGKGYIGLPLGEERRISFLGDHQDGFRGAPMKLDSPPDGLSVVEGWLGRKGKKKDANGKWLFEPGQLWGSITLKAEEPLKVGDELSVVAVAVVKQRQQETHYPAPAIPIRITEPTKPRPESKPEPKKDPAEE